MNKDKRNNIKLLGTLNNADESGIIANANQIYDANENKSTQDVSKEHTERIKTLETKENSMQTTLENITKTGEASAASNVTYNHSDSKLDATNVQQAIDEVSSIGHFAKRGGVINISTNYNSEHTVEVLTLTQAIAKVPSSDRVLGFTMTFLSSDGWKNYQFIGTTIDNWTNINNWTSFVNDAQLKSNQDSIIEKLNTKVNTSDIVQQTGNSTTSVMSQKAVSDKLSELLQEAIDDTNVKVRSLNIQSIYSTHVDWNNGDNNNKKIPLLFNLKKGESITLSVSNVDVTYNDNTPSMWAVTLTDETGYINEITIYEEGTKTYTATHDIAIKDLSVNINIGVETLSLDIQVESGELIKQFRGLQKNVNNNTTNIEHTKAFIGTGEGFYHLKKGVNEYVDIYGNFKAGFLLDLDILDFNYTGIGNFNVNIYDIDNNKVLIVSYGIDNNRIILQNDSTHIRLRLGYKGTIETFFVAAKVLYGTAVKNSDINPLIKGERYTISKLSRSRTFYNDFKAGDIVKISVSNFNYEGSGAMAVFLNDGTEYVYHLDFNSKAIDDYTTYVILVRDCSYIDVGCTFVEGITTISADFDVLYNPNVVKNTLKIDSQRESGCWRKLLDYSNPTENNISIVYPFKSGELLVFVVNSLETNSPSKSISISANNNVIISKYKIGYGSYVFENDTNAVKIAMSQNVDANDFTADVEVLYGKDAENYIKEQNELPFLDVEEKVFSKNGTTTDYVYKEKAYVGYKKPFDKDCIIKSLSISSFNPGSTIHSYIGKSYNFVIGTIDQRNWLLPRMTFTSQIKEVKNGIHFDFSDDTIIAKEGEVIFIEMTPTSDRNVLCGLSSETYDANNEFMVTHNLNTALTAMSSKGCDNYRLKTIPFNTIFVQKDEIKSLQSQINSLQNRLNTVGIYEDRITGIKYHITVSNGNIVLQSLNIKSMMVIGHSFVNYENSPEVGWYLDDGENRAMAASVNEHQWTSLIKDKLGLTTLKLVSGVDFERNYSTDYDFASKLKVTDEYDAICIYLCENAVYNDTMQESWEAMLNYLKSAAPKARIFCTGSWSSNNKQQAIQAACENTSGVTYVNMLPVSSKLANHSSDWHRGDYYYGRESTYYPIGAPSSHPNDKGMLDIANTFLNYMGVEQIENKTHNITLNQTSGGIIGTPNVEWLENGIVTIRCTPDVGHSIQSVSVQKSSGGSIEVTRRTNNYYDNKTERVYYTFTMPNEDVVVTPEWTIVQE